MKRIANVIGVITLVALYGCATSPSATPTGPRTIVLDGKSYSESDLGEFISWHCTDHGEDGRTLVEVGTFENSTYSAVGFVLYDGGYTGDFTNYQRQGLNNRWDWGTNDTDYSFLVKPDGTGLFYDFSSVPKGESIKANDVYECHRP